MKKPIIGVTVDSQNPNENEQARWYSRHYYYVLRAHYTDVITKFGGVPIIFAQDNQHVDMYADMIDGLMITGGGCDVPPELYHQDLHPKTDLKPRRSSFEFAIAERCKQLNKPMLGICGGMQVLNVLHGGSLIQHIPDHFDRFMDHIQKDDASNAYHPITIQKESKLYEIVNQERLDVNSSHHQGIDRIGEGLKITAHADDGMIEAFENVTGESLVLGLQWHPEFEVHDQDCNIFKYFIHSIRDANAPE